ncbi:MAG: hypothetical protein WA823_00260 [Candidatus Acidiferrales bacterium]
MYYLGVKRLLIALSLLLPCRPAEAQKSNPPAPMPREFTMVRDSYFDFGPPFNYYELFVVRDAGSGSSPERISLTPQGFRCWNPPTTEVATASLAESVSQLLGTTNPCAIPEKEVRREQKRCKHCMNLSGARVVMQVQCGAETRLLRMDILDRDMFDAAPNTPEHTAWTMALLQKLDSAAGPGVLQKPAFGLADKAPGPPPKPDDAALRGLAAGKFDSVIPDAPDKLSALYQTSREVVPVPSVRLVSSMPVEPSSTPFDLNGIDKQLILNGTAVVAFDVDKDGKPENVILEYAPRNINWIVTQGVLRWERFPKEAAGTYVQQRFEFRTNCPQEEEKQAAGTPD